MSNRICNIRQLTTDNLNINGNLIKNQDGVTTLNAVVNVNENLISNEKNQNGNCNVNGNSNLQNLKVNENLITKKSTVKGDFIIKNNLVANDIQSDNIILNSNFLINYNTNNIILNSGTNSIPAIYFSNSSGSGIYYNEPNNQSNVNISINTSNTITINNDFITFNKNLNLSSTNISDITSIFNTYSPPEFTIINGSYYYELNGPNFTFTMPTITNSKYIGLTIVVYKTTNNNNTYSFSGVKPSGLQITNTTRCYWLVWDGSNWLGIKIKNSFP